LAPFTQTGFNGAASITRRKARGSKNRISFQFCCFNGAASITRREAGHSSAPCARPSSLQRGRLDPQAEGWRGTTQGGRDEGRFNGAASITRRKGQFYPRRFQGSPTLQRGRLDHEAEGKH